MTLAAYQAKWRDCLGACVQSGDDPLPHVIAPRQIATESFNGGRIDADVRDCYPNILVVAFSIIERTLDKSHDHAGAVCRNKFFAGQLYCFGSKASLPAR